MPVSRLWYYVNKEIVDRLTTRFTISETTQRVDPYFMPRVIFPITNADELLKTPKNQRPAKDISAAAGTFTVFAKVPDGKRWNILFLYRPGTLAATSIAIKVGGVEVSVTPNSSAVLAEVRTLWLDEGDDIGMYTTGNAGDNNVTMQFHYLEEDAY